MGEGGRVAFGDVRTCCWRVRLHVCIEMGGSFNDWE